MTSEEEERPRFVTGGTGVNGLKSKYGEFFFKTTWIMCTKSTHSWILIGTLDQHSTPPFLLDRLFIYMLVKSHLIFADMLSSLDQYNHISQSHLANYWFTVNQMLVEAWIECWLSVSQVLIDCQTSVGWGMDWVSTECQPSIDWDVDPVLIRMSTSSVDQGPIVGINQHSIADAFSTHDAKTFRDQKHK